MKEEKQWKSIIWINKNYNIEKKEKFKKYTANYDDSLPLLTEHNSTILYSRERGRTERMDELKI